MTRAAERPTDAPTVALSEQDVLFVDCQTTGATPAQGHVLELGWARGRGSQVLSASAVDAHLLALPEGADLPRQVTRITGITQDALVHARPPEEAWRALCGASADLAAGTPGRGALTIIHYARFESRFLADLAERYSPDVPFPLDVVCTHAIARLLLPELPRRGLRALAGYFGGSPDELRRSAGHVVATSLVWHHLCQLLAERDIADIDQLRAFMEAAHTRPQPKRARRHAYPMERARRLTLPDQPGVYHFLRQNGDLLYVGKATSLARRVNTYFQKQSRIPDRTLEMLTQARDVRTHVVASPLEAALLECEHIKSLQPPYNVALKGDEARALYFASPDFRDIAETPSPRRRLGPLRSPEAARFLSAIYDTLERETTGRADALLAHFPDGPDGPGADLLVHGVERFRDEYLLGASGPRSLRALLWLGHDMWRERLLAAARDERLDDDDGDGDGDGDVDTAEDAGDDAGDITDDDAGDPGEETDGLPWDAERVSLALARTTRWAVARLRRGAWLRALSESSLVWRVPDARAHRRGRDPAGMARGQTFRSLIVEGGAIMSCADARPDERPGIPRWHARRAHQRLACFDLATYDRLRVLTTELRRVVERSPYVSLRLGPRRVLHGAALSRTLAWV